MIHDQEKSVVNDAMRKLASRKGYRATAEARWARISRVLEPADNRFFNQTTIEGQGLNQFKMTSVPQISAHRCTSAIVSLIAPESQPWHGLEPFDLELTNNPSIREYLQGVSQLLHRYRYSSDTSFNRELYGAIQFAVNYGTGVMYTEANYETQNVSYRNTHLREHYFQPNPSGIIEDNIREYKMYPEEIMNTFKDVADSIPGTIRSSAEQGSTEQYDLIHCVHRNPMHDPTNPLSMKYVSYHILEGFSKIVRVGGYNTFPYHVFTLYNSPLETYGRGFGDMMYEEIMTANEIRAQDLYAQSMASSPPVLMKDASRRDMPVFMPRTLMPGGLDAEGRPMYQPFMSTPYPKISTEALAHSISLIEEGFMLNLFRVLTDPREMTLGEVELRQREKLMQAAPVLQGLQMNNGLASIVLREQDIHASFGHFEPPPPELMENNNIQVRFEAPMNQIQRMVDVEKLQRTVQTMAVYQPFLPEIMDYIEEDKLVNLLSEGFGAPQKVLRTPEEVAQIRQSRAQANEAMTALQALPMVAQAQKNFSEANRNDRTI
jgi:Bacteriophage head to tail connecting protein